MERELVGKLRARVASLRYRNPARGLKVIAVAGSSGKTTTALLLTELLQEAGSSVMTLTNHGSFVNGEEIKQRYDTSADALQRCLQLAKQKHADFVIVEVTEALVDAQVLPTILIEMSIITNDSQPAHTLLEQPVNFTVVPSGFDINSLSVAPHQAISFGDDATAEAQITATTLRRRGTEVELVIDHQTKIDVASYLIGKANVRNIAAAVSAAYVLAADMSTFQEGIARLERVVGNFDYIETKGVYDVAVDAAVSAESLALVLSSAAELKKRRLLVALDSSIAPENHASLKQYCDRLLVVGDVEESPGIEKAEGLQEALELIIRGAKKDDLILLIGKEFAALEPGGTKAHRMIETMDE